MRAGRVIANDPAQGGAVAAGGVRAKLQVVWGQLLVELVEHQARLDPHPPLFNIHLQHLVQVSGQIDHQSRVDGLSGQGTAAPPGQDRNLVLRGQLNRSLHIRRAARDQHTMGHDLVDAGIGAVKHPAVRIRSQFAGNLFTQRI